MLPQSLCFVVILPLYRISDFQVLLRSLRRKTSNSRGLFARQLANHSLATK